jgi:hypothetical protein
VQPATIAEVAVAVPIGFAVGVVVGLASSSRWRLVTRERYDQQEYEQAVRRYSGMRGEDEHDE